MVSLSESFYIFLVTSVMALFMAFIKLIYDSKCKKIGLCGLNIERDTITERDIENNRIEHGTTSNQSQSIDRPINEIK